ncbi:unnamed protein product [Caenorhabditis bovis]|uniref:T20D4.11-like domain-containing protein n=1 Tax=Caenorhabditis bovis TaxID=2654633 RepID=A0A8S1EL37_9PELO|nr:unnamed protein product [Caenorhabditis bovis]
MIGKTILFVSALVLLSECAPKVDECSISDNLIALECKPKADKLRANLKKAEEGNNLINLEFMKNLQNSCEETFKCMKPAKCEKIIQSMSGLEKNCEKMKEMATPIGQCLLKNPPEFAPSSVCNGFFKVDKMKMEADKRCKYMRENKECVFKWFEEKCGKEIRKDLEDKNSAIGKAYNC